MTTRRAFLAFFLLLSIFLLDVSRNISMMNQADYERTVGFMLGPPVDVVPYNGREHPAFLWPYLAPIPNPFHEGNSASVYFWLLGNVQRLVEPNFDVYLVAFISKIIVLICCLRIAVSCAAFQRLPNVARCLFFAGFALAFFYSHNIAFLNSLYAEHAFLVGIALLMAGITASRRSCRLLFTGIGLLLAAASKPQFFYLPALLAAALILIAALKRTRIDVALLFTITVVQAISLLPVLNSSTRQVNYYHSLYFGSYKLLTPGQLQSLGVRTSNLECVGVDWWGWRMTGADSIHAIPDRQGCDFKDSISFAEVLRPYLKHPFLLVRLAAWSLPDHFTVHYFEVRPVVTYFRPANGVSYGNGSILIAASNLREALVTRFWIWIVLLGILLSLLPGPASVEFRSVTLFLALSVPTQIAASLIGEGVRDLSKHLAGAQLCLDLLSVVCAVHVFGYWHRRSRNTFLDRQMGVLAREVQWPSFAAASAFLGIIGIVEYFLFFRGPDHFFQGETIFLFSHRPLSVVAFLKNFVSIDASGRYRPIGNWLVASLFYPGFGLNPVGYRVIGYFVFFAVTGAVFVLIRDLTGSRIATYSSTLFFAVHTVSAYATYDVSFVTEMMYSLFYVGSVIAYVRYLRTERRIFLMISLACFVGGLWSKEMVATLPVTLVAVGLFEMGFNWKAIVRARWHAVLMVAYIVFTIGYLNVYRGAFQTVLKPAGMTPSGNYNFVLDPGMVLQNVDHAFTWAFNLPRGPVTEPRMVPHWALTFLKAFRLAIIALGLILLFRYRRRWLLLGLAWFLIAVSPPLFLFNHFDPYYLFLPLVGFSLVIGGCIDWLYQSLSQYSSAVARTVCFVPLVFLTFVCSMSIRNDQMGSRSLGISSRNAQNSINDVKELIPHPKPNSLLYIIDDEDPGQEWDQGLGGLFGLYYPGMSMQVQYSSDGTMIPIDDPSRLTVLMYDRGRLRNVTGDIDANPDRYVDHLLRYVDGPYKIKLDPTDVIAGSGSYVLTVEGLANKDLDIQYVVNDGPFKRFAVHLDSKGQAKFDVSSSTPKGLYKFKGFNLSGSAELMRSDASVTVR